jgi:hypothetical protein
VGPKGENGIDQWNTIVDLWIEEKQYTAWDSAVRHWARVSEKAESSVLRVDLKRIDVLRRILADLAFARDDAELRARIVYFHQVGYYTPNLHEDASERLRLRPYYNTVFFSDPERPTASNSAAMRTHVEEDS